MAKERAKNVPMTRIECEVLHQRARAAALEAVAHLNVVPMVVQQHASAFDDKSPVVYQEVVSDGVCGFAWVKIKPANSDFAKYLIQKGAARKDSYEPGVSMWISDYNQSLQKKAAFAHAYARILREKGIVAYGHYRID